MKNTNKQIRWGILGTGNIANIFAKAIENSATGKLIAIASRSKERAKSFADSHKLESYYDSYSELLLNPDVDVVYVGLPHNLHCEWSINAAKAGKHILCEKPGAINYQAACKVIEEVKKQGVFYMEAFMYRFHSQTRKFVELLKSKTIGDIRLIEASFCYHGTFSVSEKILRRETGGGGILDVGCYPVSMVRLIAAIENNVESIVPDQLSGMAHIGKTSNYDEWATASMRFRGDILAQISTSVSLEHRNDLRVFGTQGSIYIPSPWLPGGRDAGTTSIYLKMAGDADVKEITVTSEDGLYSHEVDTVAKYLCNNQADEMTWQDSLDNIKTLEMWRNSVDAPLVQDSSIQTE